MKHTNTAIRRRVRSPRLIVITSQIMRRGSVDEGAALDAAHVGDIYGALGTIRRDDHGPRHDWRTRASTLLAILGPGLIVMVGDNDAGAFCTPLFNPLFRAWAKNIGVCRAFHPTPSNQLAAPF